MCGDSHSQVSGTSDLAQEWSLAVGGDVEKEQRSLRIIDFSFRLVIVDHVTWFWVRPPPNNNIYMVISLDIITIWQRLISLYDVCNFTSRLSPLYH